MKLYPGRAPNYRLKQDFAGLVQGTFVQPIRKYHLPTHILKDLSPFFDEAKETMCYTSDGFKAIPWELLEAT